MKCKRVVWFCVLGAYFVLLLCKPRLASEVTLARLSFFVRTVFPSLFVSMCLSGMLVTSPIVQVLYRFPFGVECTVFALGVLCGFPVGARSALLLYQNGQITKKRAEFLCGFANLASLPFLIGVVGSTLFEDMTLGMRLAGLQAVCALAAGVALYIVLRPDCCGISAAPSGGQSMSASVASSAHTMLELGGMIVFFGVGADMITRLTDISGVPAVLLQGFLEFSSGCAGASAYGGTVGVILATLSVGFSGLCVFSQVASVTKGALSMRPYVAGKLIQTALMGAFAVLTNV